MELAERVKKARTEVLCMTQREVAIALGIDQMTVSKWERGVSEPRPRQLRSLARLAELPISWFFENEAERV